MIDVQPAAAYSILHCTDPACNLRFPVPAAHVDPTHAPTCARCHGPARVVYQHIPPPTPDATPPAPAIPVPTDNPICAVVDSLRSAYNVGSILRAADGAGLHHVYVCGISATPRQAKVRKTALGAEASVPWSYHPNAPEQVATLQAAGWQIVALETGAHTHSIFAADSILAPHTPLALVVGNELYGIDPAILALADHRLHIPMLGRKASLNVATAFGIAAYWLHGLRLSPAAPS